MSTQEILARFEERRQLSETGATEKENAKVRMECLVELMRIGQPAAPVLIECLQDEKAPPA
ncbi:MAG TPA: hypothetical protein VKE94_07980, partial [Gemmataceae bacterium]|nr:hypothetical protein [Gemmataceae bacterium]